jgi:hypothetical protein
MSLKGHWFCDNCDDIVFMSYEKQTQTDVACPDCGHLAANFVPATVTRKMLPAEWFEAMRKLVDSATTPELFDQRNHEVMR